jgi:hypothetical protein
MADNGASAAAEADVRQLALDAYGVRVQISTNSSAIFESIDSILPPGSVPCDAENVDQKFSVTTKDGVFFDIDVEGDMTTEYCDADVAVAVLERRLRAYVALNAPDRIFVHSGAVVSEGRAILIPGPSFSGKTTLVSELVRAGATYYSDEYAVLDESGLVHPYTKSLSMRLGADLHQTDQPVTEFGGEAGDKPAPVGLIVVTHYRPDAEWSPQRLTAGQGSLALLANTVPAQDRPKQALSAATAAVENATVLEGDRGEAAAIVDQLLNALRQ